MIISWPEAILCLDGDAFFVISYFRFANPGTSSFEVVFNFNSGLFRMIGGGGWGGYHSLGSVAVDLVAATNLQPVT